MCCFVALRQIRIVKRSVTRPVLLSLVLTRRDYDNATLGGLIGPLTARPSLLCTPLLG